MERLDALPGERVEADDRDRDEGEKARHEPPAPEGVREPERQKRERRGEEARPGRGTAVGVEVARVDDQEERHDGEADERLGAPAAARHHDEARNRGDEHR